MIHLRRWFSDVGVPNILYTDGGPQFTSRPFAEFRSRWKITHIKSSPHFPQSNEHTETAVKAVKMLSMKTTRNGNLDEDAFRLRVLE